MQPITGGKLLHTNYAKLFAFTDEIIRQYEQHKFLESFVKRSID